MNNSHLKGNDGGIVFSKMTGSGNDFILVNLLNQTLPESNLSALTKKICHRSLSLGADGAIYIEKSSGDADFKWRFYNSDGSKAEMCGNGARCAARFAYMNRIAGKKMTFETIAGTISAEILNDEIKVGLTAPTDMRSDLIIDTGGKQYNADFINTGVPHTIIFTDDIEKCNVDEEGRKIRFHEEFKPAGTNVNFVEKVSDGYIKVRTYERGVEAETLACGTGSVASAIFHFLRGAKESPVTVLARSGEELKVYIEINGNEIAAVFLQGKTRHICNGVLERESWDYK